RSRAKRGRRLLHIVQAVSDRCWGAGVVLLYPRGTGLPLVRVHGGPIMAEDSVGERRSGSGPRSTVSRKGAGSIKPERVGEGSARMTPRSPRLYRDIQGQNRTGHGNPWK